MLSTGSARSTARSARLTAARDYATEVVQHAESQDNLGLEDKILGNLGAIVVEAIDCVRSDQPFRSSSLSMLSLELLSYLRQPNKPMLVNFACAFTMLMSELEGIDLTERTEGGSRSYSNSIPDVPPEAAATSSTTVAAVASFSSPASASRPSRPAAAPVPLLPPPPPPQDFLRGLLKEEFNFEGGSGQQNLFVDEDLDQTNKIEEEIDRDLSIDQGEDGRSESSFTSGQGDLLQRMIANFAVPSTSSSRDARSDAARNQHKNKTGRFESRDDELAATYALPVSAAELETMADQEMARLLRSEGLTEQQKTIMRQIRKRARSKVSSREYRRRKEAKRREQSLNASSIEPASK
ncbi:hypothetical protein PMAYCL1PPCAC_05828 [Pristionchus mayeri]|uniref:BZIP domain-containing protein n=1 Tax=Pristionchus mayeri TaxID=1317129 RepID=A0AAN4Z738_9BILA|nr:hypothetical protein PMAYCL1PPCAC_05828 [Pristionchus mayeri]